MAEPVKRAWFVWCKAIKEKPGVYAAETAGKARAAAMAEACDVGYRVVWKDFRVRRAPGYDGWAAAWTRRSGIEVDYLEGLAE